MNDAEWWRGAVIYQIYPRSFRDASGDGVGDLPGILEKLDYVASLGVDAIWISPFFKSPMKDFGYDVSDYRAVDPLFGSLEDFDRIVGRAHELGLKVLIDLVLSHTSDEHEWFAESRRDRDNPRADWYVWADPRPDGTPPNNWLSVFGGSAWNWESRRRQYYLHNFLTSQPDLNVYNRQVRKALLGDAEFWLRRGVDGFRLDAINFLTHDPDLRDNPPRPADQHRTDGIADDNPYGYQLHLYDKTQPETVTFLKEFRALLDRYPGSTSVGEVNGDNSLAIAADYTRTGDRLHMAYTFNLLSVPLDAAALRSLLEAMEDHIDDGWPCWSFGNHDVKRAVTRLGGDGAPDGLARLLVAMLLSLRGSVCLYQGEELGLPEAEVPYERIRDPYGIPFWPVFKGRDGCRTPMPWQAEAPHAGFSAVEPWLPVPDEHRARAVDREEGEPGSVLHHARRLLAWRKQHPALSKGGVRFHDAPAPLLALEREHESARILCVFNLGADDCEWATPDLGRWRALDGHGYDGRIDGDRLRLPGYGAFYGMVA